MRHLFVCSLLVGFAVAAHAGEGVLLGVLEEAQQCRYDAKVKVQLRPLFASRQGKWQALNTPDASVGLIPERGTWVISFDGKQIGEIETKDSGVGLESEHFFTRDRALDIVASKGRLHVPNRSKSFRGWCEAPTGRPLVLVANGSPLDPEGWKVFSPSREQQNELFANFKARAGKTATCSDPNGQKFRPFPYGPEDVRALRSYMNNKGQLLITLALKSRKDRCDGIDEAWDTQTFWVDGSVTYVGANVELIDAGDYDSDGASELVFWFSGYNKDGYILFTPRSGERCEYFWGYH